MSTPTVTVVTAPAAAPPITPNHIAMAARLQAKAEAQQAANMVSALPRKVVSTPRKIAEFLRLPQIANAIKGGAGRVGGWLGKAAAPAAGFIKTVGVIPASVLFATGDMGQATIRWVARSVWGLFSWTVSKAARLIDRTIRIFGRPGNWLADRLLAGTTKTLHAAAVPVGATYAVTAPLVSSKSGHVKLINRLARVVVVHRVVRMFVRNPFIAWPLELFIDMFVIGKMEQALARTTETAEQAAARLQEAANEAKAQAAVDAHLAAQAAGDAKVRMDTKVQAERGTTIPQAMGKIGEQIEKVSKKTDEMLDNTKTPAAAPSPTATSSGGSTQQDASKPTEDDQPGQPVESVEELAVRLEAEGKIGQVTLPASATREQQLDAAQKAADAIGEDVVAFLPDGKRVVVEPTGTVVEQVIEADGPEVDGEAPAGSRGTERALRHAGAQRKASGKRRG